MAEMKIYKVAVTEILRKVVAVEAKSEAEAHRRAGDAWQNGEYQLDGRDLEGAEFHVLGELEEGCKDTLERVDGKWQEAREDEG